MAEGVMQQVKRKGRGYLRQVPRYLKSVHSDVDDFQRYPPILCNSVPKSGTHLLSQILNVLDVNGYGSFLASSPSRQCRERSMQSTVDSISKIVPGELVSAHLYYDSIYRDMLNGLGVKHFFIYRDPRDIVVSEAYYLRYMNRFHRLHKVFRQASSDKQAILLAIKGLEPGEKVEYGNIASRYERYIDWISCSNVLSVRYEDLMGPKRMESLKLIAEFYMGSSVSEPLLQSLNNAIKPSESHTFREHGVKVGNEVFDCELERVFEQYAGDLVQELGYH